MVAIIGGIAVGIAIALNLINWGDDTGDAGLPAPPAQEEVVGTAGSTSLDTAAPATTDDVEATDAESGGAVIKPTFDVVRVNPGGSAVIAGRAEPGAEVEIYDGKTFLGSVIADQRGEWVFVPAEPLSTGNRQLSLRSRLGDGESVSSDRVVMIVVPEAESAGDETLVLSVPSDGGSGTEVLQKPGSQLPTMLGLDSLDYDAKGEINVAGSATPNAILNVYIDDTYIGTAQADERGRWRLVPETRIKPGQYEIRVDEVDEKGAVQNRVAMPFVRETPERAIQPGTFYVVQPGNSLWRIARRTYGQGEQYTLIFAANTEQIRDPDLIYPGQIFSLPE